MYYYCYSLFHDKHKVRLCAEDVDKVNGSRSRREHSANRDLVNKTCSAVCAHPYSRREFGGVLLASGTVGAVINHGELTAAKRKQTIQYSPKGSDKFLFGYWGLGD